MERYGSDLEEEPDPGERRPDEQQRVELDARAEGVVDPGEADGARVAEEEGRPEEQEGRGEGAEEEVLEGGLRPSPR